MINWLNLNQGFVMSVLTLVYVVATIIIVYYNRIVIREMQQSREDESRPYVFANLHKDPRDTRFSLIIKNYGNSSAQIESIDIEPKLKFISQEMPDNFMKGVVLAPNQMVYFLIAEKTVETYKKKYIAQISYKSVALRNQKIYDEQYEILTDYASNMGYSNIVNSSSSKSESALVNIVSELESIRFNIK